MCFAPKINVGDDCPRQLPRAEARSLQGSKQAGLTRGHER